MSYTWWAQRRGFIRNTLQAGLCDLIPGVPYAVDMLRTTAPYYRSTYVFVSRADDPDVTSFDDPRLRELRIGVQLIGDDGANSPPVHALGRRGIVGKLRGYSVYGDYTLPNPPSRIIDAVASGDVDVAVAWGPLAGYFAAAAAGGLAHRAGGTPHRPADAADDLRHLDGRAARRRGPSRRARRALAKHRPEIDAILAEYGVPRVDAAGALGKMSRTLALAGLLHGLARRLRSGGTRYRAELRRGDGDSSRVAVTTLAPGGGAADRPSAEAQPSSPPMPFTSARASGCSPGSTAAAAMPMAAVAWARR